MPEPRQSEPFDDIDRLLTRLDRAPVPTDLTARVLASTVARGHPTRAVFAWPWLLAAAGALAGLALAGYQLGISLGASDGLELILAVFGDLGLLLTAPGDTLAALSEVIPWTLVAGAGLSAAVLILAVGQVASPGPGVSPPVAARRQNAASMR